jgi:hypothetical protein
MCFKKFVTFVRITRLQFKTTLLFDFKNGLLKKVSLNSLNLELIADIQSQNSRITLC